MPFTVNVLSLFQKRVQVSVLLSTGHRHGRHDAGLLALGQRARHGAAPGPPAAQPEQPLLRPAQVRLGLPHLWAGSRPLSSLFLPTSTPLHAGHSSSRAGLAPRPSASLSGSLDHGLSTTCLVLLSRLILSGSWMQSPLSREVVSAWSLGSCCPPLWGAALSPNLVLLACVLAALRIHVLPV